MKKPAIWKDSKMDKPIRRLTKIKKKTQITMVGIKQVLLPQIF